MQCKTVFYTSMAFLQYTVIWLENQEVCAMQQLYTMKESYYLAAQRVQSRHFGLQHPRLVACLCLCHLVKIASVFQIYYGHLLHQCMVYLINCIWMPVAYLQVWLSSEHLEQNSHCQHLWCMASRYLLIAAAQHVSHLHPTESADLLTPVAL